MVRDETTGKLNFQWKDLAVLFMGVTVAATIPVAGAMVVMYGDVREIKTSISTQKETLGEHRETLREHGHRLSALEQAKIEQ